MKIELRYQKVGDARDFYRILTEGRFEFFASPPGTLEEEKAFLRKSVEKRKNGLEFNFSVMNDRCIIGGAGVHVDFYRPHIGELGYFVDRDYWNQGVATEVVKQLESFAARQLRLKRLEILVIPGNTASIRVAEKSGYLREGTMKNKINHGDHFEDAVLYAKLL